MKPGIYQQCIDSTNLYLRLLNHLGLMILEILVLMGEASGPLVHFLLLMASVCEDVCFGILTRDIRGRLLGGIRKNIASISSMHY